MPEDITSLRTMYDLREEGVKVKYEGKDIILPAEPTTMNLEDGIGHLIKLKKQLESPVNVSSRYECSPMDGANALSLALQEAYGMVLSVDTPGFWGDQSPQFVSVKTGFFTTKEVIWGRFTLPKYDGAWLETSVDRDKSGRVTAFVVVGEVKRKYYPFVKAILDGVTQKLKTNSLYKGKALIVDGKNHNTMATAEPSFIDTDLVDADDLILPRPVEEQVDVNIFTAIRNSEACKRVGIPLKRGVALVGTFGCGKTLIGQVASKISTDNGWTFILVQGGAGQIASAYEFAKFYSPSVVFVEDIDRIASGHRTEEMDKILNTIDGISSKGHEVMAIVTSNDIENVNKAMLRPGRLDSIIHITPPDSEAVIRLIKKYARDTLDTRSDLSKASQILSGQVPATIREAVERAKLYAINRVYKNSSDNRGGAMIIEKTSRSDNVTIIGDDVYRAALGMKAHLDLLNGGESGAESDYEVLGRNLIYAVQRANGRPTAEKMTKGNGSHVVEGEVAG